MVAEIIERQAALASGAISYFTGKPCKNGHVAPRQTSNGECHECARLRAQKIRKERPDAVREAYMKYKAANRDKTRAQFKEWYAKNWAAYSEKNRERLNRNYQNWRDQNPEKRRAIIKQYGDTHKEELRARAQANNQRVKTTKPDWKREQSNKARTKFYKANPEIKRAEDARRRKAPGRFTAADIAELKRRQDNRCANPLCRKKFGAFHIDHIQAIARGGTHDPSNLQLLCPSCNCSKRAKDNVEWFQSLGLLV